MFERLAAGPQAVVDLARGMPVSRPAISQHLKVLKEAKLVTDRREGTRRIYEIDPHGLGLVRNWLDHLRDRMRSSRAEAERMASQRPPLKK